MSTIDFNLGRTKKGSLECVGAVIGIGKESEFPSGLAIIGVAFLKSCELSSILQLLRGRLNTHRVFCFRLLTWCQSWVRTKCLTPVYGGFIAVVSCMYISVSMYNSTAATAKQSALTLSSATQVNTSE